jgi:pimeloyl-ACP methyl ester carboxylesterase
VIGHSFGGGLAQMLLFTHGARIERLALVASGGLGPEVSLGLRLWSIADLSDRVTQSFLAPSTRLAIASLLPGADPEDVDFLSWMNAMPGSARALSRTVRAVVGWRGQKHQFADRAHEMVHPLPRVALFWGGQDNIVPVEHGAEMASRFEHVKLTRFEGCGHFPHQEQPEAFAAALAEFLEAPALEPAVLRGALVVVERTSRLRLWCMAFSRWILYWASWAAARARRLGTKRLPTDPPAEPSTRG